MSPDPFGRAVSDHYHGEQDEPLIQRDGETTLEHPIERFYFTEYTSESEKTGWFDSTFEGPLLDVGAGAGRHTLYFQEQFETVALEVSDHLVELMDERGVEDTRRGDMFGLRETFERDRFRSVLVYGTQVGLSGSMGGLREFLGDLAFVTTPDATAVVDSYDPDCEGTAELLGYRADPTPGLASRVMTFEYEGDVGETLCFRLFSPDRMREATVGTGWELTDVRRGDQNEPHYLATLQKR